MLQGRKRKTQKCFYVFYYSDQNCRTIGLFSDLSGLSLDTGNRACFFLPNLSNFQKKNFNHVFTYWILCRYKIIMYYYNFIFHPHKKTPKILLMNGVHSNLGEGEEGACILLLLPF